MSDSQDSHQWVFLGEALDSAPFGASVSDENGIRLAVNRRACELTGHTRGELIGKPVESLSAEPPEVLLAIRRKALAGNVDGGYVALRRKDGTTVDVLYGSGPAEAAGKRCVIAIYWPIKDLGTLGVTRPPPA